MRESTTPWACVPMEPSLQPEVTDMDSAAGSEAVLQFRRPERGIGGYIDKMLPLVRIYIHKQGDAMFVAATAGAAQGGGKTVRPVGRIVAEHRGRSSIRKGRKTQSQNSCSPEGEEIEG